jgi:lysophospholipase L1-like esterase
MRNLQVLILLAGLVPATALAATTPPPKVVFIGDEITYGWTSGFAANPNWINKGVPSLTSNGEGSSSGVLARFQSDVVSLHPAVVHIMIGAADAYIVYDSGFVYYVPQFWANLDAMVKEARAANIKVILGLEAQNFEFAGNLEPLNAVIAAYGAANNIPVVNYEDALCACTGSINPGGVGYVGLGLAPQQPLIVTPNGEGSSVPSAAGYSLMTQMAENAIAIATMNLKIKSGYLQNVQANNPNEGTDGPTPNVNTVESNAVIQFTPQGLYSDGVVRPLLSSSFAGSSGTWVSSNPLVMYVSQNGLAWALTPGTAAIMYTSPSGVRFNEWVMYVQ